MKIIQTLNDVEWLKARNTAPLELIKRIEADLLHLFNAESPEEYLFKMRLPRQEALFLLEAGDNVLELFQDPLSLEFVEKCKQGKLEFYKICQRSDHEFSLYYVDALLPDEETKEWLEEHAE